MGKIEVDKFLRSEDLQGRPFVNVHVRMGDKKNEVEVPKPSDYIPHIVAMCICLGTNRVFLMTETPNVVNEMGKLLADVGLKLSTFNFTWPGADVWNPDVSSVSVPNLGSLGKASVMVWLISQYGSGFVGMVQSSWARFVVGGMYRRSKW